MALASRIGLRIMIAGFGGYCATVLGLNAIGLALPAQTSHSISITVQRQPGEIIGVLADTERLPSWNRQARVIDGIFGQSKKQIVMRTPAGSLPLMVTEFSAGSVCRVVAMIGTDRGSYRAKRTYEILPIGERSSSLRLTEQVQISNPLLRVLLRIFQPKFLQEDVEDIQRRFADSQTCIDNCYLVC